jgi:hypothetical protein
VIRSLKKAKEKKKDRKCQAKVRRQSPFDRGRRKALRLGIEPQINVSSTMFVVFIVCSH